MEIPDGGELPADATLIFHVSGKRRRPPPEMGPRQRIDLDGLICHDDGISVTCVECFDGDDTAQFAAAAKALCSHLKVRKSGVIAKITVAEIQEALEGENVQIKVVRDKIEGNDGHCLIQGIDPGNIGVLGTLAEAVRHFTPVTEIDGLVNA